VVGRWALRLLPLLLLGLALASALSVVRDLRNSFWCVYTNEEDIRRSALDNDPRLTVWDHPSAWAGSTGLADAVGGPAFLPEEAGAVVGLRGADGTNSDLHVSEWNGRDWSDPRALGSLNSSSNEFEAAISRDGAYCFFTSDREGGAGGSDIWLARRAGHGWDGIVCLSNGVNSAASERGLALTPDGRDLLFASDRTGGAGGFDIYRARLIVPVGSATGTVQDALPAVPVVLSVEPVGVVNSAWNDRDPAVSPSGDQLWFASDRPAGRGGLDLYACRVIRGVVRPPQSLGVEVNTAADESGPALRMDGYDLAYIRSVAGASRLMATTCREVVGGLDLSRLESYLALMNRIKWWVLALVAAIVALVYLVRRYRDLTNRFHKCLMASVIVHLAILTLVATWTISKEVKDSMEVLGMEMVMDKGALAEMQREVETRKEAVELDRHDRVAAITPAIPKVAVQQADIRDAFVVEDEFAPQSVERGGIVLPGRLRETTSLAGDAGGAGSERSIPLALAAPRRPEPLPALEVAAVSAVTLEEAPAAAEAGAAGTAPGPSVAEVRRTAVSSFSRDVKLTTRPFQTAAGSSDVLQAMGGEAAVGVVKAEGGAARATPTLAMARSGSIASPAALRAASALDLPIHGADLEVPAGVEGGTTNGAASSGSGFDPAAAVARIGPSFRGAGSAGGGGTGGGAGRAGGSGAGVGDVVGGGGGQGGVAGTGSGTGGGGSAFVGASRPGAGRGGGQAGAGASIEGALAALGKVARDAAQSAGIGALKMDSPGLLEVPAEYAARHVPDLVAFTGRPSLEVVEALGGSGQTEGSIRGALDWFTRNQEPDGRWSCERHGGEPGHDVAVTAFALLCYYGWGMKHNVDCEYLKPVERGIRWLAGTVQTNGDLRAGNEKNGMYDQGIGAMALCEAYGVSRDATLLAPASNAIAFIARAQNPAGGWRYQPLSQDVDLSVFGWQYMALHSARLAGVPVRADALTRASNWIERVSGGQFGGHYGYDAPSQTDRPAMYACGMFCRQLDKWSPDQDRMKESAAFLRTRPLPGRDVDAYYLYYATLALYQHQGEVWEEWNRRMKEVVPPLQRKTGPEAGSWDGQGRWGKQMGRAVTTGMVTLSLEVYYRFLPMYGYRSGEKDAAR
jgi:hypothetical protein